MPSGINNTRHFFYIVGLRKKENDFPIVLSVSLYHLKIGELGIFPLSQSVNDLHRQVCERHKAL